MVPLAMDAAKRAQMVVPMAVDAAKRAQLVMTKLSTAEQTRALSSSGFGHLPPRY
jgi:hypothetical protein